MPQLDWPDSPRDQLAQWRDTFAKNWDRVLPFVGAGLSIDPAAPEDQRLPSWGGLIERLIARMSDEPRRAHELQLLSKKGPVHVASRLGKLLGPEALQQEIRRVFANPASARPPIYDRLTQLPCKRILTTNYDPWIRDALHERHGEIPERLKPSREPGYEALLLSDGPWVFHLHGYAAEGSLCVLTGGDYASLQYGDRTYSDVLASFAYQKRFLFLGYSLSDPDVEHVLALQRSALAKGSPPTHLWLVPRIDEVDTLLWLERGIQPIAFANDLEEGGFERLADVLEFLAGEPREAAPPAIARRSMPRTGADSPPHQPDDLASERPFVGFAVLDQANADFFFGRDKEVQALLDALRSVDAGGPRWVHIEGVSGTGKSSLARAGVLPQVRGQCLTSGGPTWRVGVTRPGRNATASFAQAIERALLGVEVLDQEQRTDSARFLSALRERGAAALFDELDTRLGKDERLLILIDQMEELFTLHDGGESGDRERGAYQQLLSEALDDPDARVVLLSTLRKDFDADMRDLFEGVRAFPRADNGTVVSLEPMPEPLLALVVRKVVDRAGLRFDDDELPQRIAAEAAQRAAPLPLVALVLEQLWQQREGDVLSSSAYEAFDGLGGVLESRANALLEPPDAVSEERLRRVFLELVEIETDGRIARRVVDKERLIEVAAGGDRALIERLLGRVRLLGERQDSDTESLSVEVLHESVLRDWAKLRTWIDQERPLLARRRELESIASVWARSGGPATRFLEANAGALLARFRDLEPTDEDSRRWLHASILKRQLFQKLAAAFMVLVAVFFARAAIASSNRDFDDWVLAMAEATESPAAFLLTEARSPDDPVRALESALEALEELPSKRKKIESRLDAVHSMDPSFERSRRLEAFRILADYADRPSSWPAQNPDAVEKLRLIAGTLADAQTTRAEEWDERWEQVVADPLYGDLERSSLLLPLPVPEQGQLVWGRWVFLLLGSGAEPLFTTAKSFEGIEVTEPGWLWEEGSGIVLRYLPAGSFRRGPAQDEFTSAADWAFKDELPQTDREKITTWSNLPKVQVSAHLLALTELTEAQAGRLGLDLLSPSSGESPNGESSLPVARVTWLDASSFSAAIGGRLPTEAEWERAAKADETWAWVSGSRESLGNYAWFEQNSELIRHEVGSRRCNSQGLYDMAGNVEEWCSDWYLETGYGDDLDDPSGATSGTWRVLRGGSYRVVADWCRSAYRDWDFPAFRLGVVGFRVAFPAAPSR